MLEIERKFLVSKETYENITQNAAEYGIRFTKQRLEQAYLRKQDPEVRIRREITFDEVETTVNHFLTIKNSGTLEREECEHLIDMTLKAWTDIANTFPSVIKVRNKGFTEEGYELVLDHVLNSFEDLYLCEVEFPSLGEAEAWKPFPWIGDEVTGNPDYRMANLCV